MKAAITKAAIMTKKRAIASVSQHRVANIFGDSRVVFEEALPKHMTEYLSKFFSLSVKFRHASVLVVLCTMGVFLSPFSEAAEMSAPSVSACETLLRNFDWSLYFRSYGLMTIRYSAVTVDIGSGEQVDDSAYQSGYDVQNPGKTSDSGENQQPEKPRPLVTDLPEVVPTTELPTPDPKPVPQPGNGSETNVVPGKPVQKKKPLPN